MTSNTDTQEARAPQSNGDTPNAEDTSAHAVDLETVNRQLAEQPTADLHRQRIDLLDDLLEAVGMVRESLDWLAENDDEAFAAARAEVAPRIQAKLDHIQAGERLTSFGETPRSSYRVIEQLEPLADYFPVIHLDYGQLLMQETRPRGYGRERSLTDMLDHLLAGSDNSSQTNPERDSRERDRLAKVEKARAHLRQAVALLDSDDERRGEAFVTLGKACERLTDLAGAFRAYREAHETYDIDQSEKLEEIEKALPKLARHRVLSHIDQLLAAGDVDAAAMLLQRVNPTPDDVDFRVRAADLALLRGDLDDALARYDDLME